MIILLYHYSQPRQLHPEMEMIFGIQKSQISTIIQTFSEALYNVAINYMVNPAIRHPRMPYYAELISNNTGGVARDIWGFIDGTIHKTARPIYHQQTVYTRFKKCHGLKFQSVYVPDGFIACLFGPVPVKTHNSRLLQESELLATHYATNSCHYNQFTLWRSSIPSKCILTWRFSKCGGRIR